MFYFISPSSLQCMNPGAHASIVRKPGAFAIANHGLPLEHSWDVSVAKKYGLRAFCVWPRIAQRNAQWYRWIVHAN